MHENYFDPISHMKLATSLYLEPEVLLLQSKKAR